MRFLVRTALLLLVLGGAVVGGAYWYAGRLPGPVIEVKTPEKYIGQDGQLSFSVETPDGRFSRVEAVLEQQGRSTTLFSTDPTQQPAGEVKQESANRMFVIRPIGKRTLPSLAAGPAKITISASRPVVYGLRTAETVVSRDVEVRLDPPRVSVLSLHHFVNHGGPEFIVFRASPEDAGASVRVGDAEYPAFPGTSAGIREPGVRVAFFALRHDQDATAPIALAVEDVAGNRAAASVDARIFARPFAKSTIDIDDRFLQRVVPVIAQNTPAAGIDTSDLVKGFLTINRDLRRQNNQTIADLAQKTRPGMLWREAFSQLGNTAIESRFADYRTYFYKGQEIDRQVHLGFDLASLQQAPVTASNRGVVIFADYLGIYGNTVIVDHGLGVQTLYAHLSTIGVKEGESLEKGQSLGRTGSTGLAAGDHLHFTMLVNGVAVSPIEMWDPHWIEDRVLRKIREAGGQIR